MQNTSTQRPDYASIIPGKDPRPVEEQARLLLASVRIAIKHERVEIGEFNRGYFDEKLSKVFNRNAAVSTLRASRPKLLPEARKAFYDFKIAIEELETSVAPAVEKAVLTLIANEVLKKPADNPASQLQPVKIPVKEKPAQSKVTRTVRPPKKTQAENTPVILDKQSLIYQRAEKILASTLAPIQQRRTHTLGKIPEGFEERFSKIVDNNPDILTASRKNIGILPTALKQFRDFQMALEVLNYQRISDEIKHAALSIIINRMTEKPRAPAKITAAQKRKELDLIRRMLQGIGKEIRQESQLKAREPQKDHPGFQEISATAFTEQTYAKSLLRAEMIISFVREARAEKRTKSFRTRRDYDSPLYDSCNNNADLVTMRAQRPSASFDLEREFRLIVITASRLKPSVLISEPVRQAIISMLVHEAKDKAVRNHERLQDHARNIGRSAAARAAASETLSAVRNDPVKAAEHNRLSSERIKKLYEDPEDKSGFRENRKTSFRQQQRDSYGHFIKAEEPALVPK